jgi:hypothetical protein
MLPSHADAWGPELSLEETIHAFLDGARSGFCDEVHIQEDMMLAARMIPLAVRVGFRSLLIRATVVPAVAKTKRAVEKHLGRHGLIKVEPDARLGDTAALQATGVRGGVWDLWGDDPAQARRDLERAAVGDDVGALQLTAGFGEDSGPGMTLEELFADLKEDRPGQ